MANQYDIDSTEYGRYALIPYIAELAANVSAHGAPPQRPLLYDFPDEPEAWEIDDQFMFGPKYLVAPILTSGQRSRYVFFPGKSAEPGLVWKHYFSGTVYKAGANISVPAPLSQFPLFTRTFTTAAPPAVIMD